VSNALQSNFFHQCLFHLRGCVRQVRKRYSFLLLILYRNSISELLTGALIWNIHGDCTSTLILKRKRAFGVEMFRRKAAFPHKIDEQSIKRFTCVESLQADHTKTSLQCGCQNQFMPRKNSRIHLQHCSQFSLARQEKRQIKKFVDDLWGCLGVMLWLFFKVYLTWKYFKIIFFIFKKLFLTSTH